MPPSKPTARTAAVDPPVTRARPRGLVFTMAAVLPIETASRNRFMSALVRSLSGFFAKQGHDMARDPAAIDLKGAGFLGQAFAANDEPGLGLRQVFIAQVADGDGVPFLGPPLHGIEASFDIAEKAPGLAAGLIWGQSTGLANRKASRLALTIAKLDHIRLEPARLYPEAEAPQVIVPQNPICSVRLCRVDSSLRQLHGCRSGKQEVSTKNDIAGNRRQVPK